MNQQPKDTFDDKLDQVKIIDGLLAKITTLKTAIEERNAMKGDVSCDKCEGYIGYGWDAKRHEVELVGDLYAVLCTPCLNAWGDSCLEPGPAKDAYDSMRRIDCTVQTTQLCHYSAGTDKVAGCDEQIQALRAEKDIHKLALRQLAKAWVSLKPPVASTATP